jgi:hypothetical protein
VLIEGALLWLLKPELLADEPLEKLGAGLLCIDEEDEELDEVLDDELLDEDEEDELLVLAVVECCAKSEVETSVRLATIRINRRMTIPPAPRPDYCRNGSPMPSAELSILPTIVKKTHFRQRSVNSILGTSHAAHVIR